LLLAPGGRRCAAHPRQRLRAAGHRAARSGEHRQGVVASAERVAAGEGAWLTPEVAAAALGIDEPALREWIAAGLLPWLPDEHGAPLVSRAAVDRMRVVAHRVGQGRSENGRSGEVRMTA
jgi:hypothetical protein